MKLSWYFWKRDFWRRGSVKKDYRNRKIYIGEVTAIHDEKVGVKRESEDVNEGDTEESTDTEFDLSNMTPHLPKASVTKRRNSIGLGLGKTKSDTFPQMGVNAHFPSNKIISSRYTWFNFLPKNILEQLRRIVNFYFVFMCLIQSFSDSPVSPVTTATPLIFVMLVTAVKQGYEDWLRHCADNLVNNRIVNIIKDGKLMTVKAKELMVGNVVKVEGEEQVPADILVVGSSDEFLRCQITTANLDGETNLKIRYCPGGLPNLKTEEHFPNLHAVIECDQPSTDLYVFNGSVLIPYDRIIDDGPSMTSHSMYEAKQGAATSPAAGSNTSNFVPGSERPKSGVKYQNQSNVSMSPLSNFLQIPISMENIALRGTRLKNTDFIYGIVIYTGKDTRLALNSQITNTKFSTVERTVNAFLILFIILLLCLVIACTGLHFFLLKRTDTFDTEKAWYLNTEAEINNVYFFNTFATFLILFNYIIPISLYVTMELQKFFGSKFFVYDLDMRCPVTGQLPLCNTSDLNEELGQIEYLFSDKTGTLTQNVMQFRFCSVNTNRFDLKENDQLYLVDDSLGINDIVEPSKSEDITKFLRTLALCHTVQLMPHRRPSFDVAGGLRKQKVTAKMKVASSLFTLDSDGPHYSIPGILANWEFQGSSPDEKALLEACCKLGVIYLGEKQNEMTLDVFGQTETYKRHYVLEFDADRKCMSVIVEDKDGQLWLFCKGAENSIVSKADSGPVKETLKHIVDFALMGMRTLAVAERRLTQAEFESFTRKIRQARRMVKHREERMREIYASMERNLTIIGATGVEDQLQEGVPETLQALSAAGIRVWMITGDKIETAVNVGISCGLVTPATIQLFATNHSSVEEVVNTMKELSQKVQPGENTTLIIDGETLAIAFKHCPDLVQKVSMQAYRVICCRMGPLQKSQVVSMVKSSLTKPITAAVGDGANDVAMIQAAHIGIGILGKEGRQAARCSDFAVARFCFLRKAILVHGHWYYVRIAFLAIYFFYKNLVFILPQVFYCIDNGFSGQTLFNPFFLTMYNIFFTACPIFTYGLQEQPHSAETLLSNPHLYKELSRNSYLTWKNFAVWHFLAIYHSVIIYYIPRITWETLNPEMNDWASYGTLIFCNVLAVTHAKMFEFIKFVSGWTIFSFGYSLATLLFFTGIFTEVDLRGISPSFHPGDFFGAYFRIMGYLDFWLVIIFVTVTALLPDYTSRAFINSWSVFLKMWRRARKNFLLPCVSNCFKPLRTGFINPVREIPYSEAGKDESEVIPHPTSPRVSHV